jgi:hypothetical protein
MIRSYTILQAELVNQVEKHLINIMHGVSVSILLVGLICQMVACIVV